MWLIHTLHGLTSSGNAWSRRGDTLTEVGITQAQVQNKFMDLLFPRVIRTSTYASSRTTGMYASGSHDTRVVADSRLDEMRLGEFEGSTLEQIRASSGFDLEYEDLRIITDGPVHRQLVQDFGIESLDAIRSRLSALVDDFRALARDQRPPLPGSLPGVDAETNYFMTGHRITGAHLAELLLFGTVGMNLNPRESFSDHRPTQTITHGIPYPMKPTDAHLYHFDDAGEVDRLCLCVPYTVVQPQTIFEYTK